MSATPYPQNLLHSDAAQPLQLNAQVTVPPTGDMELAIAGDASVAGWPVIPVGQKMVVTVARDTAYEKKYLVSSITAGTYVSTFEIVAADREYDGLQPTAAPAGSTVEHTVSAVEMSTVNDHMRAKAAHGSDGDLIDANSAQTLTHKTLTSPTLTSPAFAGAATSDFPMGGKKVTGLANGSSAQDGATKAQVDVVSGAASAAQATADAALPKAGGTMTGAIAMGSNKITGLTKGTAAGEAMARQQIQSGVTGNFDSFTPATINFSPAFASAPHVIACLFGGGSQVLSVQDVGTSSAKIYSAGTGTVYATWIAVGN